MQVSFGYVDNNEFRISGRDDLKFLIFKIVLVFCFVLLNVSDLKILVIMIITLFAVVQFFSFNKSAVYLHYYYSKIINCQHAIIMWTVCMLIFGIVNYITLHYITTFRLWKIHTMKEYRTYGYLEYHYW